MARATLLALALLCAQARADTWLGPKPKAPVSRVVTLAPSLTETVLALDAAGALVGVSKFCDFPEVAALPKAGGFNDPSVETLVALKPDLVVVQKGPGNQKPVETLARLGIPVLALSLTSVDDVGRALETLGQVLGKPEKAAALRSALDAARAKERAVKVATPKRVLFVFGYSPLVVAGPGSFPDQLLADCGAKNVAEKAPTAWPTYSLERVVALAPDVIIDAADVMEGKDALASLGPLQHVKWVKLPTKDLLHPGPALTRALPQLCPLVR